MQREKEPQIAAIAFEGPLPGVLDRKTTFSENSYTCYLFQKETG
jgi:hypothetical protein